MKLSTYKLINSELINATKYQSGRGGVIVNRLILKTSKTPFALILALRYVELTSIQQKPSLY